jgi:hypothetical protein
MLGARDGDIMNPNNVCIFQACNNSGHLQNKFTDIINDSNECYQYFTINRSKIHPLNMAYTAKSPLMPIFGRNVFLTTCCYYIYIYMYLENKSRIKNNKHMVITMMKSSSITSLNSTLCASTYVLMEYRLYRAYTGNARCLRICVCMIRKLKLYTIKKYIHCSNCSYRLHFVYPGRAYCPREYLNK